MSWQDYVDTNLLGSGAVLAAGIYDLQGNPWAYSPGFAAQVAEVKAVSDAMAADANALAGSGITIAGEKYMFVRGDGDSVIGKKGQSGCVIHRCITCCLVATHDDKTQSGACNLAVGKLADFLRENGI